MVLQAGKLGKHKSPMKYHEIPWNGKAWSIDLHLAGPSSMIWTPLLCRNCQKLGGFRVCAATLSGACCHGPGWILPRLCVSYLVCSHVCCHVLLLSSLSWCHAYTVYYIVYLVYHNCITEETKLHHNIGWFFHQVIDPVWAKNVRNRFLKTCYCHKNWHTATLNLHYCHAEPLLTTAPPQLWTTVEICINIKYYVNMLQSYILFIYIYIYIQRVYSL